VLSEIVVGTFGVGCTYKIFNKTGGYNLIVVVEFFFFKNLCDAI
jgi:hypothetical protein